MALAPAQVPSFNPIPEPEPLGELEPSETPGPRRGSRWTIILALALAGLLVFNVVYFCLAKPADDQRTRIQFQTLLTDLFSKLADATGNKYAKTAIQTFQSMQTIFRALVNLNEINAQWNLFCETNASKALFGKVSNVSTPYTATCSSFGTFRDDYTSNLSQAGTDFASVVMGLVKMDNSIVADP